MKRKGQHVHNALAPMLVRKLNESGFYADGNGLYLKVDKTGTKRWVQRIVINGKRSDLGLGSVSLISLKEARERAIENRRDARNGGDPLAEKRRTRSIPSFEEAAHVVHEMHLPTWKNPKHAQQWINTLKQYVFPRIGSKKISTISSADILTVLTPIWTSKPETASRVRQRMGAVLKWSIAQGWRVDNPAEVISQALPKRDKTANNHHTSLPYE